MQAHLTRALSLVLAFVLLGGCELQSETPAARTGVNSDLKVAEVIRVVDGDTIIVRLDGREERLRYIGIDAPESVTPDQPVECFGPEASAENRRLVAGGTVYLESDAEDRDRYGRLLRYVYVADADGQLIMVNEALVAGGFAEAGFYPPNERYSDELFATERRAVESGTGLWSVCQ